MLTVTHHPNRDVHCLRLPLSGRARAQRGSTERGLGGEVPALLLLLLVAACSSPLPSAVVTLGTDLPACRLPAVRLRCAYDWDGTSPRDTSSCEQQLFRGASLAEVRLPASFGLRADGTGRALTLVVDDGSPSPALRRTARMILPSEGTARVTVLLRAACQEPLTASADRPCPAGASRCTLSQSCEQRGLTCGDDATCRPVDLTAAELSSSVDASVPEVTGLCRP